MSNHVPTPVFTDKACPPAGPYSQAIRSGPAITNINTSTSTSTSTDLHQQQQQQQQIWVSGQIPADASGNLIEGDIATKTAQCCRNVAAVLEAAGTSMTMVVKVGVFLTDMKDFGEVNGEYEKWFTHRPARTCVAVHQLPKGVPVEIEVVALCWPRQSSSS